MCNCSLAQLRPAMVVDCDSLYLCFTWRGREFGSFLKGGAVFEEKHQATGYSPKYCIVGRMLRGREVCVIFISCFYSCFSFCLQVVCSTFPRYLK